MPICIPIPPTPAKARPTIKALISGAAPHRADAAMDKTVPLTKRILAEKVPYALDQGSTVAADARAKAAANHGTRSTWPNERGEQRNDDQNPLQWRLLAQGVSAEAELGVQWCIM
ncbi:uncharacterized protein PpBr36_10778 [Pyricularia pennisetigena]|uniref:uncharacterized protein n=1 Tax=Pyricularia pennisetigena TaxID=1578925 RepID=UPI001150E015|nr:uncharacterized protein PpBr36_10778 [Pyricularia pennisetigena]TLS20897.1 hypothetical protein PpBr36_10778 [Pyricularia pennisetigena]